MVTVAFPVELVLTLMLLDCPLVEHFTCMLLIATGDSSSSLLMLDVSINSFALPVFTLPFWLRSIMIVSSSSTGVGVEGGEVGIEVGGTEVSVGMTVDVAVGGTGVAVKVGVAVGGTGVAVDVGVGVLVGVEVGVFVIVGVLVTVGVAAIPTPDSVTLLPSIVRVPLAIIPPVGENETPMVHEPFAGIELQPATALKTELEAKRLGSGSDDALLLSTCKF